MLSCNCYCCSSILSCCHVIVIIVQDPVMLLYNCYYCSRNLSCSLVLCAWTLIHLVSIQMIRYGDALNKLIWNHLFHLYQFSLDMNVEKGEETSGQCLYIMGNFVQLTVSTLNMASLHCTSQHGLSPLCLLTSPLSTAPLNMSSLHCTYQHSLSPLCLLTSPLSIAYLFLLRIYKWQHIFITFCKPPSCHN